MFYLALRRRLINIKAQPESHFSDWKHEVVALNETIGSVNLCNENACGRVLSKKAPLSCINRVDTADLSTVKVGFMHAHARGSTYYTHY